MVVMNKKEKEELLKLAKSTSFKSDMKHLSTHRYNPVMVEGKVNMDKLLSFLTEYNQFINHKPKPFKPIRDKVIKL